MVPCIWRFPEWCRANWFRRKRGGWNMNRRILLLSVALLALAGRLGWLLRQKWRDARAHERAVLSQPPHVRAVAPPPTPAPAAPVSPADYIEVAQKTLFSKDRNPNVVVDPPPPPKPDPPMPALPVYWGQMSFGDPVVILTVGASARAEERTTPETKSATSSWWPSTATSITFDWNGKQVERKLLELAPKEGQPPASRRRAGRCPSAPSDQLTSITSAGASDLYRSAGGGSGYGGRIPRCVHGDNSPAGTVVSGYKKGNWPKSYGAIVPLGTGEVMSMTNIET